MNTERARIAIADDHGLMRQGLAAILAAEPRFEVGGEAADAAGAGVARDGATPIAAFSPTYLTREDVPAETVESERMIAEDTSRNEGKPEAALPKIVEGRLGGFFKENVLLEQAFAKDNKKSVGQVLTEAGGAVTGFVRFRVGA